MRQLFSLGLSCLVLLGIAQAPVVLAQEAPTEVIAVRETPASFSTLAARLMPAVVNISTSQTVVDTGLPDFPEGSPLERFNPFFGRDENGFRRQTSLGSGFVIDPSGLIVTNNHVIADADEIEINFADGSVLPATLVGTDPDTDIALLKVEPTAPLEAVAFADSDAAEVGDWVIAIGNPFGLGGSVSAGIISARNRDINSGPYDDFIQTDAAINRGNSGGPLFNLAGEVVGVNTSIISPTGGSVGIGFAVPANVVERVVDQLREFGRPRRGFLGVNVQGVDIGIARSYGLTAAGGALVTDVTEDGPADVAGIEVGDLIRRFNGQPVEDTRGLSRLVAEADIGETVDLRVVRDGRPVSLSLRLAEREYEDVRAPDTPDAPPEIFVGANDFGLKFAPLTDEMRRRYRIPASVDGALVEEVDPNGPGKSRIFRGDVVIEVDFETVASPSEADQRLQAVPSGDEALLRVMRMGRTSFHALSRTTPS